MHILIPAIIDINKAAPNRLHHFINHLLKKHQITVVCINDFWKAEQIDINTQYKDFSDALSKIDVIYFTEKKISPIIQELFSSRFLKEMENKRYDVIFNYNTLCSGLYLANKFKIPMVYDLADDLTAMIRDSPQIPRLFGQLGAWVGERMIKKTIDNSCSITGIDDIFREKYCISEKKFHLLPNGVNIGLFKKVDSCIKKDMNLGNYLVLGYVGVLREWVDLSPVYHFLQKNDSVKLLVVGQEGLFIENKAKVKELGIERKVVFTGNVPYQKVPEYIAAMDIGLIPFKNNEISQNAIPLKLFEYMACEKPVISSRLRGVQKIAGNKIFYADIPSDYETILTNFNADDQTLQKQLNDNREYIVALFTWDQRGNILENLLEGAK